MTDDQLENLLRQRFSDALDAEAREAQRLDLASRVLAAIHRKERRRTILLLLTGCLAAAVCVLSGLPLLLAVMDSVLGILSEPAWLERLVETPATVMLIGLVVLFGWLLLLADEPV